LPADNFYSDIDLFAKLPPDNSNFGLF